MESQKAGRDEWVESEFKAGHSVQRLFLSHWVYFLKFTFSESFSNKFSFVNYSTLRPLLNSPPTNIFRLVQSNSLTHWFSTALVFIFLSILLQRLNRVWEMATPKEHIQDIRRNNFWIGREEQHRVVFRMLHKTVKLLSAELYAKDVHFLMELIQVSLHST